MQRQSNAPEPGKNKGVTGYRPMEPPLLQYPSASLCSQWVRQLTVLLRVNQICLLSPAALRQFPEFVCLYVCPPLGWKNMTGSEMLSMIDRLQNPRGKVINV